MNTKHLKAKILDLAIRGKLVPQDSSEGNASDLLQKIREEKGGESLPLAAAGKPSSATPSPRGFTPKTPKSSSSCLNNSCEFFEEILVSERKRTTNPRSKNASFIIKADDGRHYEQFADGSLKDIEDEIPFEIPKNWCWCRLKDVCKEISDLDHRMPKPFPNGIPYISPLDFTKDGKINLKSAKKVSLKDYEDLSKKSRPEKGDIIFPRYGTIGKIRCIDFEEPCLVSYSCATIKVNLHTMNNEFIKYVLTSPLIQIDEIQKYINETTQANVGLQSIKDFKFPLPPLSEQKRIVSAIEKAFEQIDIIEKNKLNLKTYIKQTKSKVLDLAIHGKLVEQNPQEGNAFELLEKIRREKAELIEQKKLKEDKNASFIFKAEDGKHYEQFADGSLKDVEDEIPFEIPENWCWCRIFECSECKDNCRRPINADERSNRKGNIPYYGATGQVGWINDYLTDETLVLVGEDGAPFLDAYKEKSYIINGKAWVNNHAHLIKTNDDTLSSKYLCHCLNKTDYQNLVTGSTRLKLTQSSLEKILIPLPPLSEQKRIVAKIEQVFEQLDRVEKALGK